MAKKEVDGEGLNIPNRIKALPVKRPGPIVAAVIVVLLAAMLIQGMITNPRLDWPTVWKYLFNENVLEGIQYTLTLTVISMVVAIILSVISPLCASPSIRCCAVSAGSSSGSSAVRLCTRSSSSGVCSPC